MYLVSVYFDEQANRILKRYTARIEEATGNDFMSSHSVPAHMTISACEARSIETLLPNFEHLRGNIACGRIQFVSVGMLLPYVIYVTPVLNEYLMNLQKCVYESVAHIKDVRVSDFYKPYSWLPHVTLGKTLKHDEMQKAMALMQDTFQPFEATVTEIGLAKVNPHEDVSRIKF